ncbi:hypothetical protein EBR96_03165, partial [bacterium]|nr:hypothetical protein [bacterium]
QPELGFKLTEDAVTTLQATAIYFDIIAPLRSGTTFLAIRADLCSTLNVRGSAPSRITSSTTGTWRLRLSRSSSSSAPAPAPSETLIDRFSKATNPTASTHSIITKVHRALSGDLLSGIATLPPAPPSDRAIVQAVGEAILRDVTAAETNIAATLNTQIGKALLEYVQGLRLRRSESWLLMSTLQGLGEMDFNRIIARRSDGGYDYQPALRSRPILVAVIEGHRRYGEAFNTLRSDCSRSALPELPELTPPRTVAELASPEISKDRLRRVLDVLGRFESGEFALTALPEENEANLSLLTPMMSADRIPLVKLLSLFNSDGTLKVRLDRTTQTTLVTRNQQYYPEYRHPSDVFKRLFREGILRTGYRIDPDVAVDMDTSKVGDHLEEFLEEVDPADREAAKKYIVDQCLDHHGLLVPDKLKNLAQSKYYTLAHDFLSHINVFRLRPVPHPEFIDVLVELRLWAATEKPERTKFGQRSVLANPERRVTNYPLIQKTVNELITEAWQALPENRGTAAVTVAPASASALSLVAGSRTTPRIPETLRKQLVRVIMDGLDTLVQGSQAVRSETVPIHLASRISESIEILGSVAFGSQHYIFKLLLANEILRQLNDTFQSYPPLFTQFLNQLTTSQVGSKTLLAACVPVNPKTIPVSKHGKLSGLLEDYKRQLTAVMATAKKLGLTDTSSEVKAIDAALQLAGGVELTLMGSLRGTRVKSTLREKRTAEKARQAQDWLPGVQEEIDLLKSILSFRRRLRKVDYVVPQTSARVKPEDFIGDPVNIIRNLQSIFGFGEDNFESGGTRPEAFNQCIEYCIADIRIEVTRIIRDEQKALTTDGVYYFDRLPTDAEFVLDNKDNLSSYTTGYLYADEGFATRSINALQEVVAQRLAKTVAALGTTLESMTTKLKTALSKQPGSESASPTSAPSGPSAALAAPGAETQKYRSVIQYHRNVIQVRLAFLDRIYLLMAKLDRHADTVTEALGAIDDKVQAAQQLIPRVASPPPAGDSSDEDDD